MKKKQKSKAQDLKAEKGMVSWSREEFNWVESEFHRSRANQKGANKSPGIHIETGIRSIDNLMLLMEIFHRRYPEGQVMAHFIRHQQLLEFLRTREKDLIQEGLMEVNGPRNTYNTVLIDTLCILPLTQEKLGPNGHKIYTFSYLEVVNAVKVSLNAYLN